MRSLIVSARWPRSSSSSSRSSGRMVLLLARYRVHDSADRVHEARPAILFAQQLGLARGRQLVVLRALVRFADSPLGLQPAALHQAVEGGVERTGFDLEEVVRLRADRQTDSVSVPRPPLQGAEDQHVEGALEQLQGLV